MPRWLRAVVGDEFEGMRVEMISPVFAGILVTVGNIGHETLVVPSMRTNIKSVIHTGVHHRRHPLEFLFASVNQMNKGIPVNDDEPNCLPKT